MLTLLAMSVLSVGAQENCQRIFLPYGRQFNCETNRVVGTQRIPPEAQISRVTPREQKIWSQAQEIWNKLSHVDEEVKSRVLGHVDQFTEELESNTLCRLSEEDLANHRSALYAADAAYEIDARERDKFTGEIPDGYNFLRLYGQGDVTGIEAVAFENFDKTKRIYAFAGTQVTERIDWDDLWTNLSYGRLQATSASAEEVMVDAFSFVRDHGDVILTGQSLGGQIAQHTAYFIQRNLSRAKEKTQRDAVGKLHMISFGIDGAAEAVQLTLKYATHGQEKLNPSLLKQMEAVGYYYEWDPFAQVGNFMGTPLAFKPEHLLSPYEPKIKSIFNLGKLMGSHFLPAYELASRKGGFCTAEEVYPRSAVKGLNRNLGFLEKIGDALAFGLFKKSERHNFNIDIDPKAF